MRELSPCRPWQARWQKHSAQGTVDKRLLPAIGRSQNFVAHATERQPNVQSGSWQIFQQGCGERTMPTIAIRGSRSRLRGIGDQCVIRRWLDPRQASGKSAGLSLPFHGRCKRIVAASVQHDQTQSCRTFDRAQNPIQRNRFVQHIAGGRQPRVYGDQIIDTIDFEAVTRKIEHSYLRTSRQILEISERTPERSRGGVQKALSS